MQLASHLWHHRLLAITLKLGLPWAGEWELVPVPEGPDNLFRPKYWWWGYVGQGTFGLVS